MVAWVRGSFRVELVLVEGRMWYQASGPCLAAAATVSRSAMAAHLERAAEEREQHAWELRRLAAELNEPV